MWTDQPIYFALLIAGALLWIKFGPYPILIIVAALILLSLWLRFARPRAWSGGGYSVRVKQGFREEAWVDYEEAGRTLSLRSVWANQKSAELWVKWTNRFTFLLTTEIHCRRNVYRRFKSESPRDSNT